MKVTWAPSALAHLQSVADYIAADDPSAARRLVLRIRQRGRRLRRFPRLGRMLPERGDPKVRELIEGNYRIIYRIGTDEVRITAVVHGRRLLDPDRI